jgi:hypothetical protein
LDYLLALLFFSENRIRKTAQPWNASHQMRGLAQSEFWRRSKAGGQAGNVRPEQYIEAR